MCVWQDNFLRGDGNRRSLQQQRRPRKKTKPPALTKKHKKKRRRGPRRPQKPIPPAVPQGNLLMPSLSLPAHHAHVRCPAYFQSSITVWLHKWVVVAVLNVITHHKYQCCIQEWLIGVQAESCVGWVQVKIQTRRESESSDNVNMCSTGANEAWYCISFAQTLMYAVEVALAELCWTLLFYIQPLYQAKRKLLNEKLSWYWRLYISKIYLEKYWFSIQWEFALYTTIQIFLLSSHNFLISWSFFIAVGALKILKSKIRISWF